MEDPRLVKRSDSSRYLQCKLTGKQKAPGCRVLQNGAFGREQTCYIDEELLVRATNLLIIETYCCTSLYIRNMIQIFTLNSSGC